MGNSIIFCGHFQGVLVAEIGISGLSIYWKIKINHVVDLPLILSKPLVNDFLFRYTLRYVTSTRCPSDKFQNISPSRVYFEISSNYKISRMAYKLRSSRSGFCSVLVFAQIRVDSKI
jgi:hypothetical protein